MSDRQEWVLKKNELVETLKALGFPAELGEAAARQLGSPKAMDRMIAYLRYEKPKKAEVVVDEMLAIMTEIDLWRKKKEAEEANAKYNEMLYYGFGEDED